MKARFYKAAQRELDDAVAYHERQLPGPGDQFRDSVRSSLSRIKLFPKAYSPLSRRTRRCLVSRFPYGIIYMREGDDIVVVAVAHLHRRPEYWMSRQA